MEQPIILDFGIYQFSIDSQLTSVRNAIDVLYPEIVSHTDFADFNVTVRGPSNLRRLFKPQVEFFTGYSETLFTPACQSSASAFGMGDELVRYIK